MQWYFWLDVIYRKILNSYQQNKGHHAFLLYNKWDSGEDILIYSIIRWLMCSYPCEIKHCNACYNCKLMKIRHHPDYYQLNFKNGIQTIGIDVIRACIDSIYNHARQGKVKIIFIKYVECLTNQAINALLKVLEEPPSNTYFFFKSKEYNKIPLTLLSRCIQWSITPPAEKIGLRWLMTQQGVDNVTLATCALRLCNGAPIAAKNMLESDSWKIRLILCKKLYDAIVYGNFLQILSSLDIYHKKLSLYWLITLLVDALKWQQKVERKFIINLDQIELISVIAARWSVFSLGKQLQQWLVVLRYLQEFTNINYKLLLTYRLLNWKYNVIEHCLNSWDI